MFTTGLGMLLREPCIFAICVVAATLMIAFATTESATQLLNETRTTHEITHF